MKLCEKLYELRRAAGLSQEELAEKLNVSRQAVSKWENGAAQPELSKLVELSRLYSVSVDELLSLEEAEKSEPKPDASDTPAAQETPTPTQPRRVKLLRAAAAACLVLAVGVALYSSHRVKQLEGQVSSLQSQIMSVQSNLSSQIAGISSSVREAMEESVTLTSQFDDTILNFDLKTYTCTLALALQPKTVQDDLAISLRLQSLAPDGEMIAVELVRDEYDVYRGEAVVPVDDYGFKVTAAYDTGGERQLETLWGIPSLAYDALPKLYDNVSFMPSFTRSYGSSIACSIDRWEDADDERTANLYLGAYQNVGVRSAWLDYQVDGKLAARCNLKIIRADDAHRVVQWWAGEIPEKNAYSIYGSEGAEFDVPYGSAITAQFYVELTDGTVLSAQLAREVMPSANNSGDGEGEAAASPIVLTEA